MSLQFLDKISQLYTGDKDMMVKNEEKPSTVTYILSSNQEVVKMADTKASFLMGISGVILSILVPMDKTHFSIEKLYSLYLAIFFLTISILLQVLTIYPRSRVNEKNVLHYKGILEFERDDYLEYMEKMSSERILRAYTQSIYDLAIIQKNKYKWLKFGLISLSLAIFLIAGSFLF